jgi:hypothetical protein
MKDHYRCNSTQHGKSCGNGNMICETLDAEVTRELIQHRLSTPWRTGTRTHTIPLSVIGGRARAGGAIVARGTPLLQPCPRVGPGRHHRIG